MHEKSSAAQTRDKILNHKLVKDMDPHERHAVANRIKELSQRELDKTLRRLHQ